MRRLSVVVLLLAALDASVAAQAEIDWPSVWTELKELRTLDPGSAEAQALRARLAAIEHDTKSRSFAPDSTDAQRARILTAGLGASDVDLSHDSTLRLEADAVWLTAELLPPGPARVAAVLDGLRRFGARGEAERQLAYQTSLSEARALRLAEGALPLQRILHETNQAVWSAMNLATTSARLGDEAATDAVLSGAIARQNAQGSPTTDLWHCWGLLKLGFGDESRARDYFGQALARGSRDSALMLAQLDLRDGRLEAARRGFRASILSDPPGAWALRGWGRALLPPSRPGVHVPSTLRN